MKSGNMRSGHVEYGDMKPIFDMAKEIMAGIERK